MSGDLEENALHLLFDSGVISQTHAPCLLVPSAFCAHVCSEKAKLALATVSGGLLFPLLVWGGYALLPFDSPLLETTPVRVLYTLRCAFFATIPIMLGRKPPLFVLVPFELVTLWLLPLQVWWCRAWPACATV